MLRKPTHRAATIVAAAAVFGIMAGSGNAVAARLIGSADVKDNSLQSRDVRDNTLQSSDVRNGTLARGDLNGALGSKIDSAATLAQLRAVAQVFDDRIAALEADDAANTNFVANTGSTIVDETTVKLVKTAPAGTSVEIGNLNLPVNTGQTLSFSYTLADGATYGAGAPRIFYNIDGVNYNTFDGDPTDKGTEGPTGTFTKTVPIETNGRIGDFGVVYDNSDATGSVTVFDVTVGDTTVKFK